MTGVPGSGKSTLMKYIYDSAQTTESLKIWAGSARLVQASFFFWNSGTPLQKTHSGLLRSLLYEALNNDRELIPDIMDSTLQDTPDRKARTDWSYPRLKQGFDALVKQASPDRKIFFLIDGLDELEGDHDILVDLLQGLSQLPFVKVCLSSRPWIVFEEAYSSGPRLRLHHLTYKDIQRYAYDNLKSNPKVCHIAERFGSHFDALVEEIVVKARGVFLWVRLVVESLFRGLRNRDTIGDLQWRLKTLPNDLEKLYDHLLSQIEPLYTTDSYRLIQMCIQSKVELSLLQLSFAMETQESVIKSPVTSISAQEVIERSDTIRTWLATKCAGLLECHPNYVQCRAAILVLPAPVSTSDMCNLKTLRGIPHVRLLHQSVADYFQQAAVQEKYCRLPDLSTFSLAENLLSSTLLALKSFPGANWSESYSGIIDCLHLAREYEISTEKPKAELLDELSDVVVQLWNTSRTTRSEYSLSEVPLFPIYGIFSVNSVNKSRASIDERSLFPYLRSSHSGTFLGEAPAALYDGQHFKWPSSLLELAAQYGLLHYIQQVHDRRASIGPNPFPQLLHSAVIPDPSLRLYWHLDLIKLLLERGADPNSTCLGASYWSPWQTHLYFGYKAGHDWRCQGTHYQIYFDEEIWGRWIDVCELMVRFGADAKDICDEESEVWKLCWSDGNHNFYQTSPMFPLFALQELQRRGLLCSMSDEMRFTAMCKSTPPRGHRARRSAIYFCERMRLV